jgi:hypothetical protein
MSADRAKQKPNKLGTAKADPRFALSFPKHPVTPARAAGGREAGAIRAR